MKHCDFPGSLQFSLINFVWDIEVGGASAASSYLMLVQAGDKLSKLSKFCLQLWADTALAEAELAVSGHVVVDGLWGSVLILATVQKCHILKLWSLRALCVPGLYEEERQGGASCSDLVCKKPSKETISEASARFKFYLFIFLQMCLHM